MVEVQVDTTVAVDQRTRRDRSDTVARGLVARGAGVGARVGLLFDGRQWSDFALAWLGVRKAGAVAVLFSPGAAPADLHRAVAHAGLTGLIRGPGRAEGVGPMWVADLDEVEGWSGESGQLAPVPAGEVVYLAAPLATSVAVGLAEGDAGSGGLVHAWAPGSLGSLYALRAMMAGADVATLDAFDPGRFCALVRQRHATRCGLTPALAAAVATSAAAHELSSVSEVVLSGAPSPGGRAALEAAVPGAAITVLGAGVPTPAGGAPIAASQEGMLWHEQFSPGSFNLPCLVRRYRGALDVPAMEWALAELARRHQPLRTTFAVGDGGRAWQIVGEAARLAFEDLSSLDDGERDARAAGLISDATQRPFDLATGPLFEPRLARLGPDDHVLVVRLHHTAFDDWSVDVFRRELSALYTARAGGAPSPLPAPATTFADICRRQRAALDGERGAAQRAWWRRELAGAPFALQVPIAGDGPDPEAGEPVRVDLPPALVADVRALAPTLRATPFMTVLAAFSVLLSRVTGQQDLLIASVVAHRDTSDAEPLIGCFTKKVPVRLRVDGEPTFAELVARARGSLLGALSNQDVAFDAAVQEGLGAEAAEHGVAPQVAVVFQGETPQNVRLSMPGLSIGPYEVRPELRRERHFSSRPAETWGDGIYLETFLILSLLETPEGMSLVARGVFDRAKARGLLEDFRDVLADVVAAPHRPITVRAGGGGLRGLRFSRSRTEAALRRCANVADVTLSVRDGRLVADLSADGPPPSLAQLRHCLWEELPGAPWPADVFVDGARVADGPPAPVAAMLAAMWGEISGRPVGPRTSYWQDFSFLQVLAEAREAGIAIADEQVARCRTLEMLAAALR